MNTNRAFYLCPLCFEAFEAEGEHHNHRLVRCDPGEPGGERRKPIVRAGRLASRAPRWFLEAVGSLPSRPSLMANS
ncbi:MAG: hypothetical protein ACRDH2_13715 [Anaerolineales bacterium]